MTDSDADISELARQVVDELDPGSTIGDKIVLSRRQLVAIAGGGLSAGALATLGVSEAEAQTAAGQVGTSTEPVDVQAASVTAQDLEADSANISAIGQIEVEQAEDLGPSGTNTRSPDTTYQNDSINTLLVSVLVGHDPAAGTDVDLQAQLRLSQTSTFGSVTIADNASVVGIDGGQARMILSTIVPPGYYYDVPTFGSGSIISWTERRFIA